MAAPYSLYIQKTGGERIDTYETWGIVCKDLPMQLYPEAKDLPNNDWADEDGDDTYIPTQLQYKGYDLTIEWVYQHDTVDDGQQWNANSKITDFINYLSGKDENKPGVEMTITDMYTQIQVSGVYFKKAEEDATYRMMGDQEVLTFKTTMRVTNPIIKNIVGGKTISETTSTSES